MDVKAREFMEQRDTARKELAALRVEEKELRRKLAAANESKEKAKHAYAEQRKAAEEILLASRAAQEKIETLVEQVNVLTEEVKELQEKMKHDAGAAEEAYNALAENFAEEQAITKRLSAALDAANKTIADGKKDVEEAKRIIKESEVKKLRRRVQEKTEAVDALTRSAKAKDDEIADLRAKLARSRALNQELTAQLPAMKEHTEQMEDVTDEVEVVIERPEQPATPPVEPIEASAPEEYPIVSLSEGGPEGFPGTDEGSHYMSTKEGTAHLTETQE